MKWSIFIACLCLQGCMNVATTGAEAVYNRHSLEKNITDQYITMRAYNALYVKTDKFNDTNIAIATYNQQVLLAGQVPSEWQKEEAEALVKTVPKIEHIYNLVSVQSPSSTLTRMSDAWITTKVKAKIMASDLDASQLKVVTENGTVYLMGILPVEQVSALLDLASQTDGVQSVVKVLSYMKITKTL